MDYICLVYVDENRLASLPRGERDTLLARTCDYRRDLLAEQHYQWGRWLPSARLATTLRRRDGGLRLRDGAAIRGEEQLGLVVLLRARDLDQALTLAAGLPLVELGCVEVRPLSEQAPWVRQGDT
ncbi:MAG TPA: YciI family protein [Alcanivorax sp.]|nr:YciI family protein [Alcanivorax sp.]